MLILAQIPTWATGLLVALFLVVCIMMILTVLIQRPSGGGLSGAFGSGAGSGQTAFGAKTGDALTIATITIFLVYLLFAIGLNFAARPGVEVIAPAAAASEAPAETGTGTAPLPEPPPPPAGTTGATGSTGPAEALPPLPATPETPPAGATGSTGTTPPTPDAPTGAPAPTGSPAPAPTGPAANTGSTGPG